MVTFDVIRSEYEVGPGGSILSPGEFYGEPSIVPALWAERELADEQMNDGERAYYAFALTANTIEGFPFMESNLDCVISLWRDGRGNVCHAIRWPEEHREFAALCERQALHGDVW